MLMKNFSFLLTACFLVLLSCGKDDGQGTTSVKPVTPGGETDETAALKTYIDRSKHPDFRLGVAMGAREFMNDARMREIALVNFDNLTPGNEMKYNTVVKDDGRMDFSTVTSLVSNAKAAGFGIYGHTLAWHSQQNVTYLNSLLEDIPLTDPAQGEVTTQLVVNSDCEGADMSCFLMKVDRGNFTAPEVVEPGADGTGHALMVPATALVEEAWDNQFFLSVNHTFAADEAYTLTMKIKADKPAKVDIQAHSSAGSYIWYNIAGGTMSFTTEWTEFRFEGTVPSQAEGMKTIAWNLNSFAEANNYYFDDIEWTVTTAYSGTRPQTDEEKASALTAALDSWISGSMQATAAYVTAWDVVNEAIAGGGDDGSGNYPLQHGTAGNNFFWQDYLGDLPYVRTAVSLARKHFAQAGGNPSDLRLFINDYNLESDWDRNKKCSSLVNWIKKWESDGETVIDGIGTQMHVSCSMNPATQASREAAVENMFRILAASGKLIKITELDVGITDASGNTVYTTSASSVQFQAIADYYKFIINKYFEIIPEAQQFGITVWSPLDSPADSYWRAGEPIGLWDQHYSRKAAYKAVAEAIKDNLG